MAQKKDRAEYVDYPVDNDWRFSVIDEPNDIIIRVDFFNSRKKPNKWHNVARIEQSAHSHFHSHLPGFNQTIPIAKNISREGKLEIGFSKIKEYADRGLIQCEDKIFQSTPRWDEIKRKMLGRGVKVGTTQNAKSISATARITGSLGAQVLDSNGNLKSTHHIH